MNKMCKTKYWIFRNKCRLRKYRKGIFIFLIVTIGAFIFLLAVHSCKPASFLCYGWTNATPVLLSDYDALILGKLCNHYFNDSALNRKYKLDLEGEDVLIYLHIQKTGGATFGRHLVHNLDVDFPCKCIPGIKRCECLTKNKRYWLFSRHSTGWMCGLHADWTELADCVDEWFKHNDVKSRKHRIYHYVTFLRNPVNRFLSEWQHVQRGATWKAARLHCNGRDASLDEVPFCFSGADWSGVTLDGFLSCEHNLAFNRMSRMLANLSKVNCYNHARFGADQVNEILLQSAKENLQNCAFFGIVEEQRKTQFLFEHTMGIKFIEHFRQKDVTHASRLQVSDEMKMKVLQKNQLDVGLYQYAKDLFLQRVAYMEKRLGYTVDEYFRRIRDADNNSLIGNVKVHEYDDDDDNDDDDDIMNIVNYYPSKIVRFVATVKSGDAVMKGGAFRGSVLR